ncbi:helix-turn-helix domain-containing protein [Desulfovibrio sp. OttesenSCG-928-G11]|nr:helix-turn-helix domain-containing protein [Desulfovibrio sp. OttesenSCG-928-G11]
MVDEQMKWPLIGMTLDEAAEALRVDRKTIFKLLRQGDFPARKVGVGWRIDPDAVKAWLALPRPAQETEGE